jgi:hypothetical protein
MSYKYKLLLTVLLFLIGSIFFPALSYATRYELIAPSGQLTRGQQVQFTININTEGSTVSSAQIGLTYDSTLLQYVSTTPGDAMSAVTVSDLGSGRLLFTGANNSGFSGTGVFASVNFTIIAESSGSTTLCTLWAPSATPQPTTITGTQPTQAPGTTNLPTSGVTTKASIATIFGFGFLLLAISSLFLTRNNIAYKENHKRLKKH